MQDILNNNKLHIQTWQHLQYPLYRTKNYWTSSSGFSWVAAQLQPKITIALVFHPLKSCHQFLHPSYPASEGVSLLILTIYFPRIWEDLQVRLCLWASMGTHYLCLTPKILFRSLSTTIATGWHGLFSFRPWSFFMVTWLSNYMNTSYLLLN